MSNPINPKAKVIVAMSGGVDSSVAALLLLRQGLRVLGATLDTGYGPGPEQAARVCRALGIPHRVVDIRADFENLAVADFVQSYLSGRTPNPCVACNERVKFPAFLPLLAESGAEYFATGHYVRRDRLGSRYVLRQALDKAKDQSYFLYRLSQDILFRCLFPLGDLTKAEVRALAAEAGLPSAGQKDSYDVCFISSGDYRELLRERAAGQLTPGEIADGTGRVLGFHQGLANYTLGQRRGLKIALGYPAYVVGLDHAANRLTLGARDLLCQREALLEEVNSQALAELTSPLSGQMKIRYKSPAASGEIRPEPGRAGLYRLSFCQPAWGMTPGQSAVCYQGDLLVLGGVIREVLAANAPEHE